MKNSTPCSVRYCLPRVFLAECLVRKRVRVDFDVESDEYVHVYKRLVLNCCLFD